MPKSRNNPLCKVGDTFAVDLETGEAVPVEGGGMRMLPGPPGTCEWCHVLHGPELPHNKDSLAYQMRFHAINGRWPTWTDAMAHCSADVRRLWREYLIQQMKEHGLEIPPDLREPEGD